MNFHWSSSEKRWKDSFTFSFAILTIVQTVAEITGFYDLPFISSMAWWQELLCILAIFCILTTLTFIVILVISLRGISLSIGNNQVRIKQADIFKQDGLRLIPFNEYFDTEVDDITIAHNSLNGKFIDDHITDINLLKDVILNAPKVNGLNSNSVNGKKQFPLGRIIKFKEYILLAFTHFDENKSAYLSHTDYEKCLIQMWKEIDRVYANTPVFIPLLGSGITRFTDTPNKDNLSLIKCLLCTLKMSGVHIKQTITICLTKKTMNDINIYELKSK